MSNNPMPTDAAPPQSNYYGNVNTTLLNVVDPRARRICEFGAGAGALARAIRARCAGVHYTAIELAADELAKAGTSIDVGLVRNLDTAGRWADDPEMAAALPVGRFDHVIFGDVLEHLHDPPAVLKQAVDRLVPGGSALVCIPNVQHWSVFVQLARGSWPQADAGLFDRTHIRWFTLADMQSLLSSAGLTVERVVPRVFSQDTGLRVTAALEALTKLVGTNHQRFTEGALPLQYVLVGRKPAAAEHPVAQTPSLGQSALQ